MKDTDAAKQLLDLPYAPEADALLDELERTGQFRIGLEAEIEEADAAPVTGADYPWGRGSGSVVIQDWWTSGNVALRVAAGITPADLVVARIDDSLVVRTQDGLDRATLEGYLGLIPDASTLRIVFADGTQWAGGDIVARVSSHVVSHSPPN